MKEHLRQLRTFQNEATVLDFALIFPLDFRSHLWDRFVKTYNRNAVSFWNYLDAENEKMFIDYLETL